MKASSAFSFAQEPEQAASHAAQEATPTLRELHEQYKPIVLEAVTQDTAYRNACGHSDYENAVIEGNAAIRRAVLGSGNMGLLRLYSDTPEFRQRLHREVIDETYPKLHELLHPLSDADIDAAIQNWNGKIESKHAVVRYMKDHAREKDTAAWLAREFDGGDGKAPFAVRPGSPEGTELSWPKVQRRIAQLIKEDRFYTQVEQDNLDDVDPIAIREALAQRGIVDGQVVDPEKLDNDPFIQQVMADAEQIAAEEAAEPEPEQPAYTVEPVAVYPGDKNNLPYDVVVQTLRANEPEPEQKQPQQPAPENFRIMDDSLGTGGPKEKFWRNIKAIATLKQIEQENRHATLEEQHLLSQYVGWGGLADAFDQDKPAWAAEYSELKELLTPEEYAAARGSTLNAHYTSPTVIKAIYEAVGRMGFETGNILEPSCGVGNFFGMLPESMAGSKLYGVELDPISGRIRPVIDQAVLGGKIVIEPVQLRLLLMDFTVWRGSVHLQVNELLNTIPQLHHAFDTGFGGGIEIGAHHTTVFPVVHSTVHHGVGVVLHIGIGGDRGVDGFALAQLRQLSLLVGASNVLHSIVQLVGQFQALNGNHRIVLFPVLGVFCGGAAQHHFRVVQEIAVDGKSILGLADLRPFGRNVQRTVPLLQEDNVGHHIGPSICAEGVVGKADCPQKLGALGQIPAHGGILGVHRVAGSHKGYHATGSHLVQRLGKKVVVDGKAQLVVGFVVDLILAERHIADGKIVEVPPVGGLKPHHGDVRFGIKLLGKPKPLQRGMENNGAGFRNLWLSVSESYAAS